jgi:hypothetical protein
VIVIVSVIAISIIVGGDTANALPWVAIFAFTLWLPAAAICLIVMAVTANWGRKK